MDTGGGNKEDDMRPAARAAQALAVTKDASSPGHCCEMARKQEDGKVLVPALRTVRRLARWHRSP